MNARPLAGTLRTRLLWRRVTRAAMMTLLATPAIAEFTFNPYASAQHLYDSNVYRFSRQVADVTGTTETADHSQRYATGLDTGYNGSLQKLRARIEERRIHYTDFEQLNHHEHLLDVGLDGSLLSSTTGVLNFRNERRMASLEDRRSTELILERDRVGRAALDIAVTPDWHLLTGARVRTLRSPLPDAPALPQPAPGAPARLASPNFALHETAYNVGVQLGVENKDLPTHEVPLFAGIMLEHQTVTFSGVTPQPPPPPGVTRETFDGYRLLTLNTVARYTIDGHSSFDGKLGITRDTPRQSTASSRLQLTGDIGYTRELSALTEVNARLFRRVVPFVATADATTDSGASVGAKWQPIVGFIVLADYAWASSSFRGLSGTTSDNSGRGDMTQSASLSFGFPVLRYFGIRLFGTYNDRSSSAAFNDYTSKIGGVELSFRWQ